MKSYAAARAYFSFLEVLSWAVIAVGATALLIGFGAGSQVNTFSGRGSGALALTAALPGFALAFAGFLGLVFAQIGRAGVDSAEYGQQSLKIAREQLEISRQAAKQRAAQEQSYAALQAAKSELMNGEPGVTSERSASYASKPLPKAGPEPVPALSGDEDELRVLGKELTYKGQTAELIDGRWHMNGIAFDSRELVKDYIDVYGRRAAPIPLPGATR